MTSYSLSITGFSVVVPDQDLVVLSAGQGNVWPSTRTSGARVKGRRPPLAIQACLRSEPCEVQCAREVPGRRAPLAIDTPGGGGPWPTISLRPGVLPAGAVRPVVLCPWHRFHPVASAKALAQMCGGFLLLQSQVAWHPVTAGTA